MPALSSLIERFPRHELAIHRLYSRDAAFRAICGDHEMALAALHRWVAAGVDDRVREYRELVAEIETEIGALLERSACGPRRTGSETGGTP